MDTLTPSTATPPASGHSAPPGNEEAVPFDEGHQRQLFEALDSVPDASLDYLHDLARSSAARLAEFVETFFRRRAAQREALVAAAALAETKTAELRAAGYVEGELRKAAIDGELESVTQLLALGLDPDAAAEMLADWRPLQYAAQHGNTQICTVLVEHRADVMARDRNGETALMQAAYWGHAETAAELARLEKLAPAGAQQSVAPA
jgi:ankyrin repeat protein